MKDLFDWIVWPALFWFEMIYEKDQHPDARRFTIGCLFIFVFSVFVIGLLFKYFGEY